MTEQTKFEIVKAIAYGEKPEEIAEAEEIGIAEVTEIQKTCAEEIEEEKKILRKVGYIE